jgi:hypothetical protein
MLDIPKSSKAVNKNSSWMGDHLNDKYAGCCYKLLDIPVGTHFITAVQQRWNPRKYAESCSKVFPHIVAWVRIGRGILHVKDYNGTPRLRYSKE